MPRVIDRRLGDRVAQEEHDTIIAATGRGIRTLTLNRPQKKNAFSQAMYGRLAEELNAAADEAAVRVVVLTGAGDSFSSGNDVGEFVQAPETGGDRPFMRMIRALLSVDKPVIAAVQGAAVGIGTTMLLHCDMVLASPDVKFVLPFARLGISPEAGSSLLLPMLAGVQRASELLLLGEPFGAEVAREIGLVNEVVPVELLLDRTMDRAAALAALPPASVRASKKLIRQAVRGELLDVIEREHEVLIERLKSPESIEAATAFLEKRPPDFSKFE
jgi:enoyl-CoA hydratase/carnithine racemase